jgi:hypothetical protein
MRTTCPIHKIPLIVQCAACLGSARSKKKAAAARENGLKGGTHTKKKKKAK